ncbi:MAG: DUF4440 domain-containing protein [Acidobacteriota bacterium]
MTIDRRRVLVFGAAALLPAAARGGAAAAAKSDDAVAATLQAQTQELMDAIVPGKASVWAKHLHDDVVYTAEDGEVSDKKKLVEQVKPMAAGVSGDIRVTDFRARVHGSIATATYVSDEHEDYHGHKLHCQYRSTDTWMRTPAGWKLLASQVLALKTDPPAIPLPAAKADEYCGRYTLAPEIGYEIRRKGEGLEGEQTGRPAKELKAEAPDVLFAPGRPRYRYVFQRDAAGGITGFAERREAWDLVWKKVPPPA